MITQMIAGLLQGPLPAPNCRGCKNTSLQKETDLTFIHQAKSKSPKRLRCGPSSTPGFWGQISSLPGCQGTPFILPGLQNTSLQGLGICSLPTGPWCTAVWLRSLSITKCRKSRCVSSCSCCLSWNIGSCWIALRVDSRLHAMSKYSLRELNSQVSAQNYL